jgi:hypothetical protein
MIHKLVVLHSKYLSSQLRRHGSRILHPDLLFEAAVHIWLQQLPHSSGSARGQLKKNTSHNLKYSLNCDT